MQTQFLNEEQLYKFAPSIFSVQAHNSRSESYAQIPTIEPIRAFRDLGYYPTQAMQSKCRSVDKIGFTRHFIRLRKEFENPINGLFPEIILINSHDGASSYQLKAGIFRLVCENGLITGKNFYEERIRHQGPDIVDKVFTAGKNIIEVFPTLIEKSKVWDNIALSENQMLDYAKKSLEVRFGEDHVEIEPYRLLTYRRSADTRNSLWNVFNVVQENLIRGKLRYFSVKNRSLQKVREIKSVNENIRINSELWDLTNETARMLGVA